MSRCFFHMPPRLALRFILLAVALATLIVLAGIVLGRWRASLPDDTPQMRIDVPLTGIAMPLDANGVGVQVVRDVQLSYRLQPYPAQAGQTATLTVVALDINTARVRLITPTLEIAPMENADGARFSIERGPGDAYGAEGNFFPTSGAYRLRVTAALYADDLYATVMIVQAE